MSGKQKINLVQTEQSRLIKIYTNALNELAQDTGDLVKKFQTLQQKEKYKVINDITDAVLSFYTEDLRNIMEKNYQTWYDSDVSLHKIIEGNMSGENAYNTAKKLENSIETSINEMFSNKPAPINVEDSNPNIEPEKLSKLEEDIKKYLSKVKDNQRKWIGKIDKAAEENQLFNSIRGHVNATYEGAISGFSARASEVAGISQELRSNMKKQEAALDELNSSISKSSESSGASLDSFPKVDFF